MRRIKRYLQNTSILVASMVVTLLVLEGFVRVFMPQQIPTLYIDLYRPVDDGRGFALATNLDTIMNRGERDVQFFTDEYGYRVRSANDTSYNDFADMRVLALGDSFVQASSVSYDDSIVGQLELTLSAQLNTTVDFVNTGVASYNLNHYNISLQNELASQDYDLVLMFFYMGNDFLYQRVDYYPPRERQLHTEFRRPNHLGPREVYNAILEPISLAVGNHSHLFVLFKNTFRPIAVRWGFIPGHQLSPVMFPDEIQAEDWAETVQLIDDMQTYTTQQDIPFFVILLPTDFQVELDRFTRYLYLQGYDDDVLTDTQKPNTDLSNALSERNIPFIDTLPALQAAYERGESDLYGTVDIHFGINGQRIVTETIIDEIIAILEGANN